MVLLQKIRNPLKMKKIETLIDWISCIVESNKAIIVEGMKDKKALIEVGITNPIIMINGPKPGLYNVVENGAQFKHVIILTDFDKKGKELYGKLKRELCKNGVEVDNVFREWLRRNTRLSHIEGLDTYLEHSELEGKSHIIKH